MIKLNKIIKNNLLFLLFYIFSCLNIGCQQPTPTKIAPEEILKNLQSRYQLILASDNFAASTWDSVKCDPLDEQDHQRYQAYLILFQQEFSKYPPDFVKKTGLKRIYFCKNLQVGNQFRSAVPDYYTETLYYDIYKGHQQPGYHQDVIHHEYYHMIEQEINGDAYYQDPHWMALNDKSFSYGSGGAAAQNITGVGLYSYPAPGFPSAYAKTGPEEDKAVIFACLMVKENHLKITEWAQKDTILANKIQFMKDFLQELCPKMNDKYWQKLIKNN